MPHDTARNITRNIIGKKQSFLGQAEFFCLSPFVCLYVFCIQVIKNRAIL